MHLLIITTIKSVYEIWDSKKKADARKKELIRQIKQSPELSALYAQKFLTVTVQPIILNHRYL